MAMPSQFPAIQMQNQITNQLYNAPSIFQHMIDQQNMIHQSGSWSQIPQVPPMCMPWTVPNVQHPELVRFTGEQPSVDVSTSNPQASIPANPPFIHQKRKLDLAEVPPMRPTKQFLSEEKMAAHFRDMHISTNYNNSIQVPSTSRDYNVDSQIPATINNNNNNNNNNNSSSSGINDDNFNLDLETNSVNLDGRSMHPRLILSEELKRLKQEPLLPNSLLSKLERPSMALVLWEPPSKYLMFSPQQPSNISIHNNFNDNNNNNSSNSSSSNNSSNDSIHNKVNNNDELITDLNQSSVESSVALEPMDL